jgi:hypothetical protein
LRSGISAGPATRTEQRDGVRVHESGIRLPGNIQTPDGMLPLVKEPEKDPQPRWEDQYRQQALDYHCLIHGLPPASLEQATGIPDPKTISPRMWIEKGRPYLIHIDRSIPCDRVNPLDTRKVITLACPIAMQDPSMRVAGWPRRW